MTRLGVFANCRKPSAPSVLARVAACARELGFSLFASEETARWLPGADAIPDDAWRDRVDCLLVLGGDGTVLHAARFVGDSGVPILGINLGRLGFLTSVPEWDLERALEALAQNRHKISERAVIECEHRRGNQILGAHRAVNDVVLGWGESSRIITLDVFLDDQLVATYQSDGVIVATPTGSTAHALSAGGPIVHPECECFLLCAICPHTLSNRPVVFSDRHTITVVPTAGVKRLLLSVDGQVEEPVEAGDRIAMRRASVGIRLVQLPEYNYFALLQEKLNWRGSNL